MHLFNSDIMSKEEEMGYDLAIVDGAHLYICRDDCGTGGWSIHTPLQIWEGKKNDEPPAYLLTGNAEWTDDRWSRPDENDLRQALKIATGK